MSNRCQFDKNDSGLLCIRQSVGLRKSSNNEVAKYLILSRLWLRKELFLPVLTAIGVGKFRFGFRNRFGKTCAKLLLTGRNRFGIPATGIGTYYLLAQPVCTIEFTVLVKSAHKGIKWIFKTCFCHNDKVLIG